jgi:hypothetical protein
MHACQPLLSTSETEVLPTLEGEPYTAGGRIPFMTLLLTKNRRPEIEGDTSLWAPNEMAFLKTA